MAGYHVNDIVKGTLGDLSKVQEELDEAKDAEQQGVKLMVLIELSDMMGAIEAHLEKHHAGVTLDDLKRMSDVTKRAFRNGRRQSAQPAQDGGETPVLEPVWPKADEHGHSDDELREAHSRCGIGCGQHLAATHEGDGAQRTKGKSSFGGG